MTKAILLLVAFALSCEADPVRVQSTNNPNVRVDLLFEHDGVKVYRFEDGGMSHYFADARGKVSTVHCCSNKCQSRCEDTTETIGGAPQFIPTTRGRRDEISKQRDALTALVSAYDELHGSHHDP